MNPASPDAVKLPGLAPAVAERWVSTSSVSRQQDADFLVHAVYLVDNVCCGSCENAMSHTDPERMVFVSKNAPSRTCRRSGIPARDR